MIVEVETRFYTNIRGGSIRESILVSCIVNMGFVFERSQVVTKTYYSMGEITSHRRQIGEGGQYETTLHHRQVENENVYYYKKPRKPLTSANKEGYKTQVSIESPAFSSDIEGKQIKDKKNMKEDLYKLGEISLYIRHGDKLNIEIERELEHDDHVLIDKTTTYIRQLTETILMCLSFTNELDLKSLYITAEEYKIISSMIDKRIKKRPKPEPLKWLNLTTVGLSDYFISKKADGLRAYLFVIHGFGVFLVTGSNYDMVKISDYVRPLPSSGDLILEGELINPDDLNTPTSKYTIILHDIATDKMNYSSKIVKLDKYTGHFVYLPLNLTTKRIQYTGLSRVSIMSAIADVLGECDDIFAIDTDMFDDDGIIFTPNLYNKPIYKWKPVDKLTVDLAFSNGKLVYGRSNSEYIGQYDLNELGDIVIEEGSVHEFLVHSDSSLSYVKPRPDRQYPNMYEVVRDMIKLAIRPITREDLLGVTPGVYRRYHNLMKRDLLQQSSRRGGILLDIGSGKGGSIASYVNYLVVIAVDPDPDNMKFLIERATKKNITILPFAVENVIETSKTVIYYHTGYMDADFLSSIIELEMMFNVVSSFFTLQYLHPIMAVQLYKVDEQTANEQANTLKHILSKHMMRGSAFIGICPAYKPDMKRAINRETLCRGYGLREELPIASYSKRLYETSEDTKDFIIGEFNVPGLPTLPYGHEDYIPVLNAYIGMFLSPDKSASVNITPLYARHLITSQEWIDLSYYYSSFILAEERPVNEEISTQGTFLHVSSVTENSIHRSLLMFGDKVTYEIGVISASLDACILTVLYREFTLFLSRTSELKAWSNEHRGDDDAKIQMVQDRFGIGLVIVKVKRNNVVTFIPSNHNLQRYMYVFSDEKNYCLLMAKQGDYYQSLYTDLQIVKLVL